VSAEWVAGRHIAIVPVSAMDSETAEALGYAAKLAPRVLAVHIRQASDADRIEDAWTASGTSLPLIVVDASGGDSAMAFHQALEVLKRTEPLNRITVVLPSHRAPSAALVDWCNALKPGSAVVVRQMPAGPEGAS
jgi:hypothetical protein